MIQSQTIVFTNQDPYGGAERCSLPQELLSVLATQAAQSAAQSSATLEEFSTAFAAKFRLLWFEMCARELAQRQRYHQARKVTKVDVTQRRSASLDATAPKVLAHEVSG